MSKKIFLIAGEASGDLLGAALMQDLKTLEPDLQFSGVGGPQMCGQGMRSLFPMTELSIMGLVEVIKHFPLLYKRFHQTVEAIVQQNPDVLVTIDAPDFCLRVARKIKKLRPSIKIIHYVAPTVWAWRPGRAKKIARFLDGLLCLFPFEPPYFAVHGLRAVFAGHPLTRLVSPVRKMPNDHPVLCVLPGSRLREVDFLLPVLTETLQRLKNTIPDLQVVIPTLPHLLEKLAPLKNLAKIFVPKDNTEKYQTFAQSDVALHASGTVSLELALCQTPMVTIYKVSPLTAKIVQRLIKTPYANLVNILLKHPVVPELIQDEAMADAVTPLVHALLTHPDLRMAQQEQLSLVAQHLKESPPQAAANFILSYA